MTATASGSSSVNGSPSGGATSSSAAAAPSAGSSSAAGVSVAEGSAPSGPPLVELFGIGKTFGRTVALRDVTLRLPPGRIGLIGNNGAGKSTLLKLLLGLLRPDVGRGTILGVSPTLGGPALRRRIGYMPEGSVLLPLTTGAEFVALSGELYGLPHREAARRAHEVLQYVGLGELRYRRLEEYSLGNAQRLKLAAALVHDPELLLLDEPTDGLDPTGREGFLRLLEDLVRETGKSLILSTHLLYDVERICDRLVVIDRGTVAYDGPLVPATRSAHRTRCDVTWRGEDAPFLAAVRDTGIDVVDPVPGGARLILAEGLAPRELFVLARASNVLLTTVKPSEVDVADLFFRLTAGTGTGNSTHVD